MSVVEWKTANDEAEITALVTRTPTPEDARKLLGEFNPSSTEEHIMAVQAEGNIFYREAFEVCKGDEAQRHALHHADNYWEYALQLCFLFDLENTKRARVLLVNRIKAATCLRIPFRPLAETLARDMRYYEYAEHLEIADLKQALFWLAVRLYFVRDADRCYREFKEICGDDNKMKARLAEMKAGG